MDDPNMHAYGAAGWAGAVAAAQASRQARMWRIMAVGPSGVEWP